MRHLLIFALLLGGCASAPVYPPPAADKAQVVVKVTATPKAGVQAPRSEGQYDKESVEKGRRFTRVNYSKMECIAVVVEGVHGSMAGTPDCHIEINEGGFDHDLSIAVLKHWLGNASIGKATFTNRRGTALTLFGSAPGFREDSFEFVVAAGSTVEVILWGEGLYDVYCDENEELYCQILATRSSCAQLCESGGEVFFDGVEPGTYEVEVFAPRLPVWRMKVNAAAGKRETLYAEVTVNKLPKAK